MKLIFATDLFHVINWYGSNPHYIFSTIEKATEFFKVVSEDYYLQCVDKKHIKKEEDVKILTSSQVYGIKEQQKGDDEWYYVYAYGWKIVMFKYINVDEYPTYPRNKN